MMQWICTGGCPRSGTTAFLEVFNQHPNIAMFPEYDFFTLIDVFDRIFYKEANTKSKGWIGNINANKRPGATVITKDFLKYIPQKEKGHQKYIIKALFQAVFPDKDLKVIGEKLPFYFQKNLYKLNKRIGPIKYIHITRNPLWVINSFRHRTKLVEEGKDLWKYRDLNEACDIWISAWNFLFSARDHLDILPIKYENFFDDPVGSRNEVFSFLNVEQHNITDFSGEKYGALDALTEREYELVNKIFHPLIRHWDVMSMDELLDFHGPFTEKILEERVSMSKR